MTVGGVLPEFATRYRPVPFEDLLSADRFLAHSGVSRTSEHLNVIFPPDYPAGKRLMLERVAAALNDLLDLPPDWDGEGAEQVSVTAARAALDFLDAVTDDDTAAPQVFPLPSGGVQLEWLIAGADLECEFDLDGHVYVLGTNGDGKILLEMDAPDRLGADVRAETRHHLRQITLPLSG